MTRWFRLFPAWVGFALAFTAGRVMAQDPGAPGGDTGEPLYGYLACGALAVGVVFALCKSARRSA